MPLGKPFLGEAYCAALGCGHVWDVFAPGGVDETAVDLECPKCGEPRGRFTKPDHSGGTSTMKSIALTFVLLFATAAAFAQTTPTPQTADQGLVQFMADKVKETRPMVLFSPGVKPAYVAYLPAWNFHAVYEKDAAGKPIKDPYRQFFSVGFGGKYEMETKKADGFIGCDINLIALSARAWDFAWAREHVDRSKFPPIYLGPAGLAPFSWEQLQTLNLKRDLRGMAGINYPFAAFQTSSPNTP